MKALRPRVESSDIELTSAKDLLLIQADGVSRGRSDMLPPPSNVTMVVYLGTYIYSSSMAHVYAYLRKAN